MTSGRRRPSGYSASTPAIRRTTVSIISKLTSPSWTTAARTSFLRRRSNSWRRIAQPVKFVVSHRPSWLVDAALGNPRFPLHQLATKYGVHNVIAGHVHEMLHIDLEGVSYVSLPSAGGHLRLSGQYEDGWFFAHTRVDVNGTNVSFRIEEVKPPHGQGRVTTMQDWGQLGRLRAAAK